MKAKQLQIGDYIMLAEPNKYAGCYGRILSLVDDKEEMEGAYFMVFFYGEKGCGVTEVYNGDIRPIPLTEEILLKNNFKRYVGRIFNEYHFTLNKDDKERTLYIDYHYKNNYIVISYEDYAGQKKGVNRLVLYDCKVHQLQHVLNLFRIDIDLKP